MIHQREKGFTLLELVILMVVLGTLLVLFIPRLQNFALNSKIEQTQESLLEIKSVIALEYTKSAVNGRPSYPPTISSDAFDPSRIPTNQLNGNSGIETLGARPQGMAKSENYGFWYLPKEGAAGAYSNGDVDTGGW